MKKIIVILISLFGMNLFSQNDWIYLTKVDTLTGNYSAWKYSEDGSSSLLLTEDGFISDISYTGAEVLMMRSLGGPSATIFLLNLSDSSETEIAEGWFPKFA